MQQIYYTGYFKGFKRVLDWTALEHHPQREIIEHRVKVIAFFEAYGANATRKYFGVSRSTVFLWKKKVKDAEGKLYPLAPQSQAPHRKRQRQVSFPIEAFILSYRQQHPGVGKVALKAALDAYCKTQNRQSVSESTIGRLLADLKRTGRLKEGRGKLTLYGNTGKLVLRTAKPKRKKLRRKDYQPKAPGDLVQADSVTRFDEGLKRYLITATDVISRLSFAYTYPTLSSSSAKDFMGKFRQVCPFPIRYVQTDNGSEFEKHFEAYVKEEGIPHFWNYPKHPKSNAFVERFNRTLQEQFVDWEEGGLADVEKFNEKLMDYLLWYNTEKPHLGLNKMPPLKYYVEHFVHSPRQSNMLWTSTKA